MQMVALCPDNMISRRDRALLALGFAGAFRRSELCALQVDDLVGVPDGATRADPAVEDRGRRHARPGPRFPEPTLNATNVPRRVSCR